MSENQEPAPAEFNDDDRPKEEAILDQTENTDLHGFKSEETTMTTTPDTTAACGCSVAWTRTILKIQSPILKFLQAVTGASARNPKITITLCIVIAIGLMMIGFSTNFVVEVHEDILWTPKNSKAIQHRSWIEDDSGFPDETRSIYLFVHADGKNVLGRESVQRLFQAIDAVRSLPDYYRLCAQSNFVDEQNRNTCQIHGVTRFWNHSTDAFATDVTTDQEAIVAMSAPTYPDGTPIDESTIFGYPERNADSILTFAKLYLAYIEFPDLEGESEDFEAEVLDVLVDGLRVEWIKEAGNDMRLEVDTLRSFADEFSRAIEEDIPLLPIVFIIMSVFTCLIFWKRHKVQSRSLLGFGGVVAILLSIMTSYGFMFVCGVPFTSMTTIIPFIMFGIGLDDIFIIYGCYQRTDMQKSTVERIHDTIEDCGLSITLTTATSASAFGLGCISSIPAIFWLCLYACVTVTLVLMFQLTFFIACIVLDERRVQENRRDCCTCVTATQGDQGNTDGTGEEMAFPHPSERFMTLYADLLLRPYSKVVVIAGFVALAIACGFSALNLTQEFNFADVLPEDSYTADFVNTLDDYSSRSGAVPGVYFRFVDQSDEDIQKQMDDYISDLVTIDSIVEPPTFFWLDDFRNFLQNDKRGIIFANLTFNEQLDVFLADSVYSYLYANDIVRDDSGAIISSRCWVNMDRVDFENIRNQTDALEDQSDVSKSQSINQGRDEWAFFTYDNMYDIWEFYYVTPEELTLTTITGVVAVVGLAILLIPHWTAGVFILPFIVLLYIDMLGVLQWAGAHINPVAYVALVLSIGLMVDYLMHMLLRFYESTGNRREKTTKALQTMGASILIGGISTFLGTLPLAFSTSEIFITIFYAFLALVTLGCGHGLVLFPVILSIFGPEDQPLAQKPHSSHAVGHH